jgi:hypothetical protein
MLLDSFFDHWYTSDKTLSVLNKNNRLFMAGYPVKNFPLSWPGDSIGILILDAAYPCISVNIGNATIFDFSAHHKVVKQTPIDDPIGSYHSGTASVSRCHVPGRRPGSGGRWKKGPLFHRRSLVFNGKKGYLNSPKHRSVDSWHFSCRLFKTCI